MNSNPDQHDQNNVARSAAYRELKKVQGKVAAILLSFLIGCLLLFDFLSVYARDFMGRPLFRGTQYSIGVTFAFFIVIAVIFCAAYYVRRMNKAHDAVREEKLREAQSREGQDS